ncbi:MAG: hypothetical protein ABI810_05345 [Sphingomonas bacterium]
MVLALGALLMLQAGDPIAALDREIDGRSYRFCHAFTDPYPAATPSYRLGRVAPKSVRIMNGYPKRNLPRGTIVLLAGERDGYVPIFDPRGVGVEGCVPASSVTMLDKEAPADGWSLWAGHWEKISQRRRDKDDLTIRRISGHLHVEGNASWAYPAGGENIGEISADSVPRGGRLEAITGQDSDCTVTFMLVGVHLIAFDPNAPICNGHNVSFSGVYRKTRN